MALLTAATSGGETPPDVTGLTITPRTVDVTDAPRDVTADVDVEDLDGEVVHPGVRLTDASGA